MKKIKVVANQCSECKTVGDLRKCLARECIVHHAWIVEELARQIDLLAEKLEEAENIKTLYGQLIFAVGKKFGGETRHETALRYIREREKDCGSGSGTTSD